MHARRNGEKERERKRETQAVARVIIIPRAVKRLAVTFASQLNVYYCCKQDDKLAPKRGFRNLWISLSFAVPCGEREDTAR